MRGLNWRTGEGLESDSERPHSGTETTPIYAVIHSESESESEEMFVDIMTAVSVNGGSLLLRRCSHVVNTGSRVSDRVGQGSLHTIA